MVYLVTNVLIGRFVLPGRFRPAPHAVNHKPGISDCPTSGRTRPSQGSNGHAHGHVTRLRAYAHAPLRDRTGTLTGTSRAYARTHTHRTKCPVCSYAVCVSLFALLTTVTWITFNWSVPAHMSDITRHKHLANTDKPCRKSVPTGFDLPTDASNVCRVGPSSPAGRDSERASDVPSAGFTVSGPVSPESPRFLTT